MGQIIGSAAKPKRCNLQSLSSLGTPAAGEHILVSSDNSMNAAGQGNFDAYVVGDGSTAATALELKSIDAISEFAYQNQDSDLAFVDDDGNAIVIFGGGEIKTKNFNSAATPKTDTIDEGDADFAISDENGKCVAVFENGHIRTKNFNSANVTPAETTELEAIIGKYKNKRISILGDSISTFGDPDSRNENGTYCYSYYPTETCRYSVNGNVTEGGTTYTSIAFDVQNTWWMRLINRLGAKLGINESWRGTRVAGTGSSTFNNQTRINHLGENGTPNLILVYGGTNDAGGGVTLGTFNGGDYSDYDTAEEIAALPVTTFADAYKAMLIRLMFTYPSAEIVCILPTFTTAYYTIQNLDNYVEVIKEACDFFGIKWIDTRVSGITIFNKASYLVDGIHPNANGMKLLSDKIYKHLIFD